MSHIIRTLKYSLKCLNALFNFIAEKAGPFMYPQGELESLNLALVKVWLSNILLFEETLIHQPCLHDNKRCPGTHESWVARDLGGKI